MATTRKALAARFTLGTSQRTQYRERLFFGGMALLLLITVLLGFAPSYYFHAAYGSQNVLTPSLHLHGAAFSAWMVLLLTQTSLIAAHRVDLHRKLGVAGAILGAMMALLGAFVAITRARDGLLFAPEGVPPSVFLAIPLATVAVFPTLLGAALYFRKRSDIHKRLMLIATLELVTAAVARLPVIFPLGPIGFFAATDLFLGAIVVYDVAALRRVNPATLWGGFFLIASQPLRLFIGSTDTWQTFAGWLTT